MLVWDFLLDVRCTGGGGGSVISWAAPVMRQHIRIPEPFLWRSGMWGGGRPGPYVDVWLR
jgi:hypothetical protein